MYIRNLHELALFITDIRIASGLSQAEVAQRAGVSRKAINELETGKVDPKAGSVFAILSALGARLDISFPESENEADNYSNSKAIIPSISTIDKLLSSLGEADDT